jgi:hypothetical protein
MIFKVNNNRIIEVDQLYDDGLISIVTLDSKNEIESTETISAGDFITMLNWYRYQKRTGNKTLEF